MYDFDFHISRANGVNIAIITLIAAMLTIGVVVFELIFIIIATSKANQGEPYKYPITINFIK